MRKIHILAVVALFGLSACHHRTPLEKNPVPVAESKGVNVKLTDLAADKDFVCGMPLEKESIADTASYEGKLYGFCSAECKTEFLKNPQSYLSQQ